VAPKGWNRLRGLRGHEQPIGRFAWSPDGAKIATPSGDGRVVIWDAATGKPLVERDIGRPVTAVAWSPDGRAIAVTVEDSLPTEYDYDQAELESSERRGDEDELIRAFEQSVAMPGEDPYGIPETGAMHLRVLDADSGLQIGALTSPEMQDRLKDVQWLHDGTEAVTASSDGLALWHVTDGHFLGWLIGSRHTLHETVIRVNGDQVLGSLSDGDGIAAWDTRSRELIHRWSSTGRVLSASADEFRGQVALGTESGLVEVLRLNSEGARRTLEGHSGAVTGVSFSANGRILASSARDGIKLWSTEDWALLGEMKKAARVEVDARVAFSPVDPSVLAASSGRDSELTLWQLDVSALAARQNKAKTVHYTNAKIVLVGDTGVGKSGLGLVLAGKKFEATDSTHQRNIWNLGATDTEGSKPERREVFLWDLAGQPGYRLLHQLHLSDVSVALVVFDARNELDPLAGVRYWCRALEQAGKLSESDQPSVPRILVGARLDRGGARVGSEELAAARRKFKLDDYVATSAKAGAGVETLRKVIADRIDWESLPKVSSTGLFDSIRRFLAAKRTNGQVILTTEAELRDSFVSTGAAPEKDVLEEFRVCIERVEARGLIRRLTFGDLVLLRPEVLDAYAAAVINAASAQGDGLGAISEEDVRKAKFSIPEESRLKDQATERLLLIATIEDLLKHEVALREDAGEGTFLVFPTQSTRQLEPPTGMQLWCWFEFEGPTAHVWATLVVRLSHSGVFVSDDVGLDLAFFRGLAQTVGVRLSQVDEGCGRIELLGEGREGGSDAEHLLEGFVSSHLQRRAVSDSIVQQHIVACRTCGFVMPDQLLEAMRGEPSLACPKCASQVTLERSAPGGDSMRSHAGIEDLQRSADLERSRVAARTSVQGKEQVHEFDAFLAHNSRDKEVLEVLAEKLRDEGLNPWLDSEQIPPGRWFQEIIQDAMKKVGAAVIVIGEWGLGRWQALELRGFISRCIELDIPVIPTLLPGGSIPSEVSPFLQELQVVEFRKSVNEQDAFASLVWGITGDKKARDRLMAQPNEGRSQQPRA
jgi:small GTP-binding protein